LRPASFTSVYGQCLTVPQNRSYGDYRNVLGYCEIVQYHACMTIKGAILKELNDRGWSHYRLVQEVKGKLPARTVYSFLSGERDLATERASILLQALGLQIIKPKSSRRLRR
jgi:hypothetical protein